MDSIVTLCLYHNDADGRASAAIVRHALGSEVRLHEIDYGDSIPWEEVAIADRIIIVDYSLPQSELETLATYHQVIWIDHHQSALTDLANHSADLPGIRDISEAACVLTWRYFFPDDPIPRAITLIGDRDIWRWALKDTGAFNEGLHQQNTHPKNDDLWKPLLNADNKLVNQLIEQGNILRNAHLKNIQRQVGRYGYQVIFEGYKTLVVNSRGTGDLGQHIRDLGYQIAYCYVDKFQNENLMTFVTLFSNEVDVSIIAVKYGGGGHKGAAGFSFLRGSSPFPSNATVEFIIDD